MDAAMILFDSTVFSKPKKKRQDEKPFIEAIAVWKSVSNQKSPKEIDATHGLPHNSFLAYVKWKDESESELSCRKQFGNRKLNCKNKFYLMVELLQSHNFCFN
jgi:hypothetical protein